MSDGQVTLDALSIAAPVRGPGGEVVAALSVVVHAEHATPSAFAPAVVAAARGITRALGNGAVGGAVAGGAVSPSSPPSSGR